MTYDVYVRAYYDGSTSTDSNLYSFSTLLVPPSNLTGSNITESSIDLSWTKNGENTEWEIEYGPTGFSSGSGTKVVVSTNPYTLTGLDNNKKYDAYVKSYLNGSTSTNSNIYTFTTKIAAPSNLTGSNISFFSINLSWTANDTETEWMIEYGLKGFSSGNGTRVIISSNPYTLNGLIPATEYDVYVKAYIDGTTSADSNLYSFTTSSLLPPTDLTQSNISYTSVDLSWTANGSETEWEIEYGQSGFSSGSGTTIVVSSNPYTLTGLTSGVKYDTYVKSYINNSTSANSNLVSYTTLLVPPSNLTGSNTTASSTELSWTANGSETEWEIEYGLTGFSSGSGTKVVVSSNPYTLTGLTSGTEYDVYVKAYSNDTTSENSNLYTFTTNLSAPSNLSASNIGYTSVDLSWTANGSETEWLITYSPSGSSVETSTIVTSNPYTLEGLSIGTEYNVYVKAYVNGSNSANSNLLTFTTLSLIAPTDLSGNNITISQAQP